MTPLANGDEPFPLVKVAQDAVASSKGRHMILSLVSLLFYASLFGMLCG